MVLLQVSIYLLPINSDLTVERYFIDRNSKFTILGIFNCYLVGLNFIHSELQTALFKFSEFREAAFRLGMFLQTKECHYHSQFFISLRCYKVAVSRFNIVMIPLFFYIWGCSGEVSFVMWCRTCIFICSVISGQFSLF